MNPQMDLCVQLFVLVVVAGAANTDTDTWDSGFKDKYDGYGEDWIFMPDGNGQPQVAVLRGNLEPESRGMFDTTPISFMLYTRNGPENGTKLFTNNTKILKNSDFSPSRQTKLITHGWKSSTNSAGFREMKNAFLAHGEYNVILVDWEPLAASTFYLGPMQNTFKVGKEAANFIDFLVDETGAKPEDFHFIGHSLGAHVAGNTGHLTTTGRMGRVTGLDPALPGFHLLSTTDNRLDPTDASFVDVIHSCGGVLGYFQPVGHADFYPNGGTAMQPGCCCIPELVESCSHGRSYVYFTESINSKIGFHALKCDTWDYYMNGNCSNDISLMGEHVDRSASGSYFLKTRSKSPFSYGIDILSNEV